MRFRKGWGKEVVSNPNGYFLSFLGFFLSSVMLSVVSSDGCDVINDLLEDLLGLLYDDNDDDVLIWLCYNPPAQNFDHPHAQS